MRAWRREYPNGASGIVMQTDHGFIWLYLGAQSDDGTPRVATSLATAQTESDAMAGFDPAPDEWQEAEPQPE
jgi:hypothetical protein